MTLDDARFVQILNGVRQIHAMDGRARVAAAAQVLWAVADHIEPVAPHETVQMLYSLACAGTDRFYGVDHPVFNTQKFLLPTTAQTTSRLEWRARLRAYVAHAMSLQPMRTIDACAIVSQALKLTLNKSPHLTQHDVRRYIAQVKFQLDVDAPTGTARHNLLQFSLMQQALYSSALEATRTDMRMRDVKAQVESVSEFLTMQISCHGAGGLRELIFSSRAQG